MNSLVLRSLVLGRYDDQHVTMERRVGASGQRFSNRVSQVALAVNFSVFVIIGLAGLVQGASSRVPGLVILLIGGVLVVRALGSSDVVVDESSVRTRSIVRTRRYAFSELRGVDVAVGPTGMMGYVREYLVFHRSDGGDAAFKELSSRPAKGDELTIVRGAAACINERLAGR